MASCCCISSSCGPVSGGPKIAARRPQSEPLSEPQPEHATMSLPIHIAWHDFSPGSALLGGLLIGLATAGFLLALGRIAGIAGVLAEPWRALRERRWPGLADPGLRPSLGFLAGLLLAPWAWRLFAALPEVSVDVAWPVLVLAGLLVGVGVRLANGCTSGHGVCGLSRLSPRSLAHVLCFMAAGFVTVYLLRHVL